MLSSWRQGYRGYWYRLVLMVLGVLCGAIIVWMPPPRHDPILHSIPVSLTSNRAIALVVSGSTRRAFVAQPGSVSILDLQQNTWVRTVRVGRIAADVVDDSTPVALAVDRQSGRVFVLNNVDGTVCTLDARTGRSVNTASVHAAPSAVAVDERAGHVFVVTAQQGFTDVYDARTGNPVQKDGAPDWVASDAYGTPRSLAVDPRVGHGFVADQGGLIAMFDTRTGLVLRRQWGSPASFTTVTADTRAGRVFAVDEATNNVSVFDSRTDALLPAIPIVGSPMTVVVDEQTGRAFTSNANGTVSTFDTRSEAVLRTVTVGANPLMAVDEWRGRVIVVSDSRVSVLDARSGRIIGAQPLTLAPQAIGVDEQTGHVLVVSASRRRQVRDAGAWVSRWLPHWFPFLPSPGLHRQVIPPSVTIFDETALIGRP